MIEIWARPSYRNLGTSKLHPQAYYTIYTPSSTLLLGARSCSFRRDCIDTRGGKEKWRTSRRFMYAERCSSLKYLWSHCFPCDDPRHWLPCISRSDRSHIIPVVCVSNGVRGLRSRSSRHSSKQKSKIRPTWTNNIFDCFPRKINGSSPFKFGMTGLAKPAS